MQIGRVIISLLLISIYSLGFAHTLAHHCLNLKSECSSNHSCPSNNHNDVNHLFEVHNHDGIYDLFVCLLSDCGHPVSECNAKQFSHNQAVVSSDQKISKLPVKTAVVLFPKELYSDKQKNTLWVRFNLNPYFPQPLIEHTPLRGPPTLSC